MPGRPVEAYPQAEAIQEYLDKVGLADGYIWASPVYHGTLSGLWKNGIDFLELLPRTERIYLDGKAAGLISLAGGRFAAPNGLLALQHTARALRAKVAHNSLALGPTRHLFDASANLTDPTTRQQLLSLGQEVVALVAARPAQMLLQTA